MIISTYDIFRVRTSFSEEVLKTEETAKGLANPQFKRACWSDKTEDDDEEEGHPVRETPRGRQQSVLEMLDDGPPGSDKEDELAKRRRIRKKKEQGKVVIAQIAGVLLDGSASLRGGQDRPYLLFGIGTKLAIFPSLCERRLWVGAGIVHQPERLFDTRRRPPRGSTCLRWY